MSSWDSTYLTKALAVLLDVDSNEADELAKRFEYLGRLKYNAYSGYPQGVVFGEALIAWLRQFDRADRHVAADFLLQRLVFISERQLRHLVTLVPPRVFEPLVTGHSHLAMHDISRDRIRRARRRVLVLGLSDDARLDVLRRAAPLMSHEQFLNGLKSTPHGLDEMASRLASALGLPRSDPDCRFRDLVAVELFAGSGYTLLRSQPPGLDGKLKRLARFVDHLRERSVVADNLRVTVVVYVASETALERVRALMQGVGWEWSIHAMQVLSHDQTSLDGDFARLAVKYYDPVLTDAHKGNAALGFGDGRLGLVFESNAPNNSYALIWGDTRGLPASRAWCALFPRHERHREDLP
jgi:hypothetical protein